MLESRIRDALSGVTDPELGIDVVALGLVHAIEIRPSGVLIRMGTTSPACPLGEFLRQTCEDMVSAQVPEARPVEVVLTLDPPWTPDRMSETARQALGW